MSDTTSLAILGLPRIESDGRWVGTGACQVRLSADEARHPLYEPVARGRTATFLKRLIPDYAIRLNPGTRETVTYPQRGTWQVIWLESAGGARIAVQQSFFDGVTVLVEPDEWFGVPVHPKRANRHEPHLANVVVCAQRAGEIVGLISPMELPGSRTGITWYPASMEPTAVTS